MSIQNRKRLGDIVNFKRGYDLPSYNRKEGKYPIISSGGISGFHDEYKKEGEGLITGRYGTLGEMYYINGRYWPHNTSLYATDFKGNYPKYVYYLMKCLGSLKTSDKSTVPGVNRNDLHEIIVPYIMPEFQKQISDILSNLDYKIELNNRINAELEQMAKTIYDYWFVQFDFPMSTEYAASIGQPELEGKPYKSSGGKMVWSEELKREVPEGWEVKSIGELGEISGGSTPSREINEYFTKNGIPWITPKDLSLNTGNKFITKGELDVSEQGLKSASLNVMPKGTVLLSSRAPIGYIAISREKVTTNQGFKSFIPTKGYTSEFIFYTLIHMLPTIENNAAGSTFKEVSTSTLKSIKTYLPSSELASKFTAKVKPIFERQDLLELENQKLTELRDWLLPMLMNGQVRVGDVVEEGVVGIAAEPVGEYKVMGEIKNGL